jgi:hypothetical protein
MQKANALFWEYFITLAKAVNRSVTDRPPLEARFTFSGLVDVHEGQTSLAFQLNLPK